MNASVSLQRRDWSLHRKGPVDEARHKEKVREAIRENLADIVSEEAIITSDGKKTVKVPIRSLELPRFRFDPNRQHHAGQGDGDSKVGDVIGQATGPGRNGPGKGKQAGDQPGMDYYEAEVEIDELAEVLFDELGLPDLRPKSRREIVSEDVRFNDLRKKGIFANLDKRRTILENIKRNALAGDARFHAIQNDDLRFRTWNQEVRHEIAAVVIAMRDVSGSMGEFEKFITRSFYFWMVRFLRTKYRNVEIVFLTHHTEAKEVDEQTFFTLGESGGTRVSSAYRLALEIVQQRYPSDQWNIYPFHFSDGDNWGDTDNRLCVDLVRKMLQHANLFGYGEIVEGNRGWSSRLMSALSEIHDRRFVGIVINDRRDVYPALRRFFTKKEVIAA